MATPSIVTIQNAITKAGLPVKTVGPVVVKRNIESSSSPSQHSFGNALDYYPSSSSESALARKGGRVPSLEALYDFLSRAKSSGTLPVETLCYYRRGGCTTPHLDHLHVDAAPKIRDEAQLRTVQLQVARMGSGIVTPLDSGPSYATMSPSELKALPCGQISRDRNVLFALKAQFSVEQMNALQARVTECGANNPLVPDFIEEPLEAVGDSVSSVGDFLGVLSSGELWVRVGFVVGGFATAGAGIYFIAKEFGLPSVAGGAAGAVAQAVKG